MKRLATTLCMHLLMYAVPLSARPVLLLHWQVLIAAGFSTILLTLQPRMGINENNGRDAGAARLLMAVSGSGQIASLFEWVAFPTGLKGNPYLLIAGLTMLTAGTLFRMYSIQVPEPGFSAASPKQAVPQGPYRLIRYPAYTGTYIALLGTGFFFQSLCGMLILGAGMLYVYHRRVKVEEAALTGRYGNAFRAYRERTYRMIPYVW